MHRRMYVPRPSCWQHYEVHHFLDVPTPPVLVQFSSAIMDRSYFAGTIWKIVFAEFAAMKAILSLQTALEGVTCPRCPTTTHFQPTHSILLVASSLRRTMSWKLSVTNLVWKPLSEIHSIRSNSSLPFWMRLRTSPGMQVTPGRCGTIRSST